MNIDFYKNISPEELEKYAKDAGLGGQNPVDLQIFEKLLKNRKKILEVGCGTGRIGKLLARKHDYFGIDANQAYLDFCAKQFEKLGIDPAKHLLKKDFLEFKGTQFDAILFPWTVIGDFNNKEQFEVLAKSHGLLKRGGIVILDNPAEGTIYNSTDGYSPTRFYFNDWRDKFPALGFSKWEKSEYETPVDRKREITILYK